MNKETTDCSQLIISHFQLDEGDLTDVIFLSDLEQALAKIVKYLLDHDLNRLLNAFYKIDISEEKFKNILTICSPQELPQQLAREVIQRERMKVKTREYYKNQ